MNCMKYELYTPKGFCYEIWSRPQPGISEDNFRPEGIGLQLDCYFDDFSDEDQFELDLEFEFCPMEEEEENEDIKQYLLDALLDEENGYILGIFSVTSNEISLVFYRRDDEDLKLRVSFDLDAFDFSCCPLYELEVVSPADEDGFCARYKVQIHVFGDVSVIEESKTSYRVLNARRDNPSLVEVCEYRDI